MRWMKNSLNGFRVVSSMAAPTDQTVQKTTRLERISSIYFGILAS
jgi:hypothetical protein